MTIQTKLPEIAYRFTGNAWEAYSRFLQNIFILYKPKTVCDIGGGANPLIPVDFLQSQQIDFTLLDISQTELNKAPNDYKKILQDIEASDFPLRECFDAVYTRMLAEHLSNGKQFHRNIFAMLRPGGIAVHFFPTLFALPFLVNKILPENLSSLLLDLFFPRDRFKYDKFPAYYDWCYGPTPPMLEMLEIVGFEIIEYTGLIGHSYFKRTPIVRDIHSAYIRYLLKNPNAYLTSFAQVILRKPGANENIDPRS